MLDVSLFRKPAFVGVQAGTFAIGAGMFALFPFLSIYLQDILGYSALGAGLRFLPITVFVFFVPIATRPHHTAIVIAVAKDGVTVFEQNVWPDPKKVTRSVIPKLDAGEDTRWIDKEHKIKLKVTGSVRAFHPVPKPPKDASLLHPGKSGHDGGSRALAFFVPSQGGAKRTPVPLGRNA